MRFLVDAQLSPALAEYLRGKGHEADHVAVVLGETASDVAVVDYAEAAGAVIVSKDADFVGLLETMQTPCCLLRIRVGNSTNRFLFQRLEARWKHIEAELLAGRPVVELD